MHLLNSNWLIKMLGKAGKTPEARMLALFEILADYSDAPDFQERLLADANDSSEPTLLIEYLRQQARKTRAAAPDMLAEQVALLAKISLRSQLTTNNSEALREAALMGAGIALLPDFSAQDALRSGKLVRVLTPWRTVDVFADQLHGDITAALERQISELDSGGLFKTDGDDLVFLTRTGAAHFHLVRAGFLDRIDILLGRLVRCLGVDP